jgi:hypothetical protein
MTLRKEIEANREMQDSAFLSEWKCTGMWWEESRIDALEHQKRKKRARVSFLDLVMGACLVVAVLCALMAAIVFYGGIQ